MPVTTVLAMAASVVIALGGGMPSAPSAPASAHPPTDPSVVAAPTTTARAACAPLGADAAAIMADRYTLHPHPTVKLPHDPTWAENPLKDGNWQYQFHSLRFLRTLLGAWRTTDDAAYKDRAVELLRDWLADNPRSDPPSPYSWNDHSTAWRAMTMACVADAIGLPDWLARGLRLHGTTLADPAFYVGVGNHALNQAVGLLDVGCVLGREDWMTLARSRIATLVQASVDAEGVSNEQAVEYQAYNQRHYTAAGRRLQECGLTRPSGFDRVSKMATFLVHATLPSGQYETIGDTGPTVSRFPGRSTATRPSTNRVIYRTSGWAFARTGWGTARPFADEVHTSLRFGPARQHHGHYDGGSVTLYGYGRRLLIDPGKYSYEASAWRTWFQGRTAHNVVTVDGLAFRKAAPTSLVAHRSSSRHTDTTVTHTGYAGVTSQRRVVFSTRLGYLLVEDRLTSTTPRTFRQTWHLDAGSDPAVGTSGILTRRERGNVVIRQLVGTPLSRIVTGTTAPIQGWTSSEYGKLVKAPVVEATLRGSQVRYLTLVAPGAAAPRIRVSSLRVSATGYSMLLTVDGRTERVTVTSTSSTITD